MEISNLHDVRAALCRRLAELDDTSKPVDLARARATVEVSGAIVETLKVEIALNSILKGTMALPFVELPERAAEPMGAQSQHLTTAMQPAALVAVSSSRKSPLESGPSAGHPWRSSVHRLKG